MVIVIRPEQMKRGQRVSFLYNGKMRVGTVEIVVTRTYGRGKPYVTLKHKNPKVYDGKPYSTYSLDRIQSLVNLHVSRRQASRGLV